MRFNMDLILHFHLVLLYTSTQKYYIYQAIYFLQLFERFYIKEINATHFFFPKLSSSYNPLKSIVPMAV